MFRNLHGGAFALAFIAVACCCTVYSANVASQSQPASDTRADGERSAAGMGTRSEDQLDGLSVLCTTMAVIEGGEPATQILAGVVNTSKRDILIYGPSIRGELWAKGPRHAEPLAFGIAPAGAVPSLPDFVRLQPDGFHGKRFVIRKSIHEFNKSLEARCTYTVYASGHEGASRWVRRVLGQNGEKRVVHTDKAEGTGSEAKKQ